MRGRDSCRPRIFMKVSVTPKKKTIILAIVAVVWVALDQLTKALVAGQELGALFAGPYLGLVDFRLIHNTGGAWGIFAGNTFALGIFSLAVCVALLLYFALQVKQTNLVQTIGIALIVAGGIGNAIDRFAQGYVVDFIEFSFFDFPVFNVADIGVTCGFAILFIGLAIEWRSEKKESGQSELPEGEA